MAEELQKQELTSLNIAENQLQKLKEIFPEAFTEGNKVDWDKLRLTLGENIDTGKERFGMNWPGKADCFKTIQQPSIATLVPDREESINFDTTENLFIEGDNLEVLKLLQKSYLGKVKMIYIDPPYNTGNEFLYPDNYSENLNTYLEYSGQIDGEGRKFSTNAETDGRFHSKWLNMMYPRLFLAKNLLKEDGVIFISIDDHEVHNLKSLSNEIFGEENFVTQLVWQKRYTRSNNTDTFTSVIEHILVYGKNNFKPFLLKRNEEADNRYTNPDNDPRGPWKAMPFFSQATPAQRPNLAYGIENPSTNEIIYPIEKAWRSTKEVFEDYKLNNQVWWGKDGKSKQPSIKKFLSEAREGMTPINLWDHKFAGNTDDANKEIKDLFETKVFDTPKPTTLLKRMLELSTDLNDIVLDFFAGSATTAAAVLDLNKEDVIGKRKFISVQLPEPTDEKTDAFKAGYKTIAEISKERIRRVIKKNNNEQAEKEKKEKDTLFGNQQLENNNQQLDLGFKVFKLQKSNFKIWDANIAKEPEYIQQALFEHIDHISPEAAQEAILYELLLKSGFPLATPIETITFADKNVYSIADGELLICLEKELTNEVITAMAEKQPSRVICLDEGFQDNDQLKTNAVKIMASKGVVNFRTV